MMSAAALSDVAALSVRHVLLMSRRPASIVGAVVLPLVFAVLFLTILSRPMGRLGIDYQQYLVPAIALQAMFFAGLSASIWAAEDVSSGMVQRLRAMPVSPRAPVFGLLGGELARCSLSLVVVLAAGYALGFRFSGGPVAVVVFIGTALGCATAICLAYLALGFAAGNVETAQGVGTVLYYPLLLVSSLFVPVAAFPTWLQPIVEYQPLSCVVEAMRALSLGGVVDAGSTLAVAWAWILGVLLVFTIVTGRLFGRSR